MRGAGSQTGMAMVVVLLVLTLGLCALLLHRLNATNPAQEDIRQSMTALAEAKEALIAYGVTYYEQHPGELGFLPCPDLGVDAVTEGGQHGVCGSRYVNSLGRLPWESLKLSPLRDGSGECLWYAVSGGYKHGGDASAEMLNEDTNGQLQVYVDAGRSSALGDGPTDRAVAVILAPGPALDGQDRTAQENGVAICGGNYVAANYLDCLDLDDGELCDETTRNAIDNAAVSVEPDRVDRFVAAQKANDAVNDRLVFITRAELAEAVRRRRDLAMKLFEDSPKGFQPPKLNLTRAVAQCLSEYAHKTHGSLPFAAPVQLKDYRDDGAYKDAYKGAVDRLAGRLPRLVGASNQITSVAVPGLFANPAQYQRKASLDKKSTLTAQEMEEKEDLGIQIATCPIWNPELASLWAHWKDHLFYAVSAAHRPETSREEPPVCSAADCFFADGAGPYAAVVIFAGRRLAGQSRDAPPLDSDQKRLLGNYLEGRNKNTHAAAEGSGHYVSGDPGASPEAESANNDVLYCIEPVTFNVVRC
jgi:hypothetical protein